MTRVLPADDPTAVLAATHALDAGALVVYPTDTLYGLAADALVEEAVAKVYDAKVRPPSSALPVLVGDVNDARHVARITPLARRLAAAFLPGPLTLVLPALATVPENLLAGGDTVAVRVADDPFALALARHFGPVTATSANPHGASAPTTVEEARAGLGGSVALYVDGGARPGTPSTIVDATGDDPRVLREGAVAAATIADAASV